MRTLTISTTGACTWTELTQVSLNSCKVLILNRICLFLSRRNTLSCASRPKDRRSMQKFGDVFKPVDGKIYDAILARGSAIVTALSEKNVELGLDWLLAKQHFGLCRTFRISACYRTSRHGDEMNELTLHSRRFLQEELQLRPQRRGCSCH